MFRFLVFPYRDIYFARRFGWSVRDLAIIQALSQSPLVQSIAIVQRPVTLYERILGKNGLDLNCLKNINVEDHTSFDLIGPLKGRSWFLNAYNKILEKYYSIFEESKDTINILLDFTPISFLDYTKFNNCLFWYDMIDNFIKHNRFSTFERTLVQEKYKYVCKYANLVTGVTKTATSNIPSKASMVVANGLFGQGEEKTDPSLSKYDLGFIGFITDKFDVGFIKDIAEIGGLSVVIYGKSYDKKIERKLKQIKNVYLKGPFRSDETHKIIGTFAVGLIPYCKALSHDGSPIKLYQYLSEGRAVVSTEDYPGELDNFGNFVLVVDGKTADERRDLVAKLVIESRSGGLNRSLQIKRMVSADFMWPQKVDNILGRLAEIKRQKL